MEIENISDNENDQTRRACSIKDPHFGSRGHRFDAILTCMLEDVGRNIFVEIKACLPFLFCPRHPLVAGSGAWRFVAIEPTLNHFAVSNSIVCSVGPTLNRFAVSDIPPE